MIIAQESLINSKKLKHLGKRILNPTALECLKWLNSANTKGTKAQSASQKDTAQSFFAVIAIHSLNIVVLALFPISVLIAVSMSYSSA